MVSYSSYLSNGFNIDFFMKEKTTFNSQFFIIGENIKCIHIHVDKKQEENSDGNDTGYIHSVNHIRFC